MIRMDITGTIGSGCFISESADREFGMQKDIYIWGAGKYGDMAYVYYKDDCHILGYIDSMPEKCGMRKNGIPVYAPDILKNKAAAVVIAVRNNEGIERTLRERYAIRSIFYFRCVEEAVSAVTDDNCSKEALPKDAVIIHFSGGLGNQMFQYALMKNHLLKKDNVYADVSYYQLAEGGIFQLTEVFRNIQIKTCDAGQKYQLAKRYLDGDMEGKFIADSEIKYDIDKSVLDMEAGFIKGLHQNYYFASLIREPLLQDFQFDLTADRQLAELCESMRAQNNIVSVHIRRGDYLSDKYRYALGDVCTEAYYNKAMDYMEQRVGYCKFYFFSDDIKWVKEHFRRSNATYIEEKMFVGYQNWFDMCLMSFCSHHIIANSTFSWWGAWLNPRNKMVIAPKNWSRTKNFADICPKEWIRM